MFLIGVRHDGCSSTPTKLKQSGSDLRQPSTSWRHKITHWPSAMTRQSTQQTLYVTWVFLEHRVVNEAAHRQSCGHLLLSYPSFASNTTSCLPSCAGHDHVTTWLPVLQLGAGRFTRVYTWTITEGPELCGMPHLQLESSWSHLAMSHTTSLVTSASSCTVLLCSLMHSIHSNRCPSYISDVVQSTKTVSMRGRLWSDETTDYVLPQLRTKFAEWGFSYAGLAMWNRLPESIRRTSCQAAFKRQLKTFSFCDAFNIVGWSAMSGF